MRTTRETAVESHTADFDLEAGTGQRVLYDDAAPVTEQLPRRMRITYQRVDDQTTVMVADDTAQVGSGDGARVSVRRHTETLRDENPDDGYRYRHIYSAVLAAKLGWSPTLRRLFDRRREDGPDRVQTGRNMTEDGGRALVLEQTIISSTHTDAVSLPLYYPSVDQSGEVAAWITRDLEVADRSAGEWQAALEVGTAAWQHIHGNQGGTVDVDLHTGEVNVSVAGTTFKL